jgi:hypothetical protein
LRNPTRKPSINGSKPKVVTVVSPGGAQGFGLLPLVDEMLLMCWLLLF